MASSSVSNNYGSVKYWNERYRKQQGITFDWIDSFHELRPVMHEHIFEPLFEKFIKEDDQRRFERQAEGDGTVISAQPPHHYMPATGITTAD